MISDKKKVYDAFFRGDHTTQRPIPRRRLCSPIRFVTDPFKDCGELPSIRTEYIHSTFYNHDLTPKVYVTFDPEIKLTSIFRFV